MSSLKHNTDSFSLIWGTLRNLLDFDSIKITQPFSLVGTFQGTFPIDTFHPIFLEIPRNNQKLDLSGRKNLVFGSSPRGTEWQGRRIVPLPEYREKEQLKVKSLYSMLQVWDQALIPDEIPCISIATTIKGGHSSENRIGQYSVVIIVWPNLTARILELDWFEGPLEDCISPEWYIRTSELMTLRNAIIRMLKLHKIPPVWEKSVFTTYTIPSSFSMGFNGKKSGYELKGWGSEWIYDKFQVFRNDLKQILEEIEELDKLIY